MSTCSFFTAPRPVTESALLLGHLTFYNLTTRSGLGSLLESSPSITVFVPSNNAFTLAGISPTVGSQTSSLIRSHAVSDVEVGYLPHLSDSQSLKSLAGTSLKITKRGGEYFINDAKIIRPNVVLPNGVAHIVDKLVTRPETYTVVSGGESCRAELEALCSTLVPTLVILFVEHIFQHFFTL